MMIKDFESVAASLYDGGWRATDGDDLQKECGLTYEETERLVTLLAQYEEENEEEEDE